MDCPVDGTTLMMSERQGVEIDYCPKCRGVWLDRGELDKILERSHAEDLPGPASGPRWEDRSRHHYPKKKRKNFLEDIFDFG